MEKISNLFGIENSFYHLRERGKEFEQRPSATTLLFIFLCILLFAA